MDETQAEIYLFTASFMALVGALIGRSRGRIGEGVILGLALGPVGWAVTACLGHKGKAKCPACRELIDVAAVVCPRCRTAIADDPNWAKGLAVVAARRKTARLRSILYFVALALFILGGILYIAYFT